MSQLVGLGQLISGGQGGGMPSPTSLMSPPMDPRIMQLLQQIQGGGGPQGLPPGAAQLPSGGIPGMGGDMPPQAPGAAPPGAGGMPPGLLQLIQQMPPDQLRAILQRLGIGAAPGGAPGGGMAPAAAPGGGMMGGAPGGMMGRGY